MPQSCLPQRAALRLARSARYMTTPCPLRRRCMQRPAGPRTRPGVCQRTIKVVVPTVALPRSVRRNASRRRHTVCKSLHPCSPVQGAPGQLRGRRRGVLPGVDRARGRDRPHQDLLRLPVPRTDQFISAAVSVELDSHLNQGRAEQAARAAAIAVRSSSLASDRRSGSGA
jgi:hypothetical protein